MLLSLVFYAEGVMLIKIGGVIFPLSNCKYLW